MSGIVIFEPTKTGMQFKHPEILYALLLLLIPIFIHLFQLRRFQKVPFTNVAFLKKVNMQTRKSATLKKWLTLIARMLALACLVFAFAQPISTNKASLDQEQELVLYIDNSFSMQARGEQGPMLDRALNQLFAGIQGDGRLSYFTNDRSRKDISYVDFRNEVLQIPYTHQQLGPDQWLLKAKQLFSDEPGTNKRFVAISDFQDAVEPAIDSSFQFVAVPLGPLSTNNLKLDSISILDRTSELIRLEVLASNQVPMEASVPVSLYDGNRLLARTTAALDQGTQSRVTFEVPADRPISGHVEIADPLLDFDNRLYFTMAPPETISVLGITEGEASYLQDLFGSEAFQLNIQNTGDLDYGVLESQNLIVLDGLVSIPVPLRDALLDLDTKGTGIVVIPSATADPQNYNQLLQGLGLPRLGELLEQEVKLTKIHFDHPLFEQVFEREVANFQYPLFQSYYRTDNGSPTVLSLENGDPLLSGANGNYLFSASLDRASTNFKGSPIIVPVFLNMAKESLPLPRLYYEVGQPQEFALKANLGADQVLSLADSLSSFIPRQQARLNSVAVQTQELPDRDGVFGLIAANDTLAKVAYNYPRKEGLLQYGQPQQWSGVTTAESMGDLFDFLTQANAVQRFWKWFAIFALIFLLIEMLILKFYR